MLVPFVETEGVEVDGWLRSPVVVQLGLGAEVDGVASSEGVC